MRSIGFIDQMRVLAQLANSEEDYRQQQQHSFKKLHPVDAAET